MVTYSLTWFPLMSLNNAVAGIGTHGILEERHYGGGGGGGGSGGRRCGW